MTYFFLLNNIKRNIFFLFIGMNYKYQSINFIYKIMYVFLSVRYVIIMKGIFVAIRMWNIVKSERQWRRTARFTLVGTPGSSFPYSSAQSQLGKMPSVVCIYMYFVYLAHIERLIISFFKYIHANCAGRKLGARL